MGKVNINDTKATKTAREAVPVESKRGKDSADERSESVKESKVEKNVGVKMTAKNDTSKSDNKQVKSANKEGAKTRELAVVKKPTVKTTEKPKNITVHDSEVDEGMALIASRAAVEEFERPTITKMKQQRGKSMSGMLVESVRPTAQAQAVQNETKPTEEKTEKAENPESEADKEKFSKMSSILIGVGAAVVVAVIGFAGIAIFGNNKEKCTVSFESNGGSKIESTEIVCGRTVKRPSDPTKDGFEFEGWILEGDPFDFAEGIYKSSTLVAKWKAAEDTEILTVTFDADGGTAVAPVEVAKGKTLTEPNAPTKANWTFTGWYLGDEKFDFSKPIEENITLKAGWKWAPVSNNGGGNTTNRPSGNGNSNNGGNTNNGGSSSDKPAVDDENTGNTGNNGENNGEDKPPVEGGDGEDDEQKPGGTTGDGDEDGNDDDPGGNTGTGTGDNTGTGTGDSGTGTGTGTGTGDTTGGGTTGGNTTGDQTTNSGN